jgi:hypothetical protein
MSPGEEIAAGDQPKSDGLEAYRRLIELQKQMIELGQQHEQSKRECHALRELVALEVEGSKLTRQSVRQRLRESAARLWRRMPGLPVAAGTLNGFKPKQPDHGK